MAEKPNIVRDPVTGEVHVWDSSGAFQGTHSLESLGMPKGQKNYSDQEIQDALLGMSTGIANTLGVPKSVTEPIKKGSHFDVGQILKDLAVDAASQAPLVAMPGGSIIKNLLRGGVSLGTGAAADQLLNPQREVGSSVLQGGANTAVGMLVPGVHENTVDINPSLRLSGNPLFRLFAAINPGNIQVSPRMVTKNLVGRNRRTGQLTPARPTQVPIKLTDLQKFLEGFGSNALFDTTLNRTDREE